MPDLTHGDDAAAVNSLRSAVMRLSRRLKHQRVDESLSPTEMSVLGTLARCGSATPGELARKEHVQPPSMTRIVALLEAQGPGPAGAAPRGPAPEGGHPDRAGRSDARREPPQAERLAGRSGRGPGRGRVGQAARRRPRAGEARASVGTDAHAVGPHATDPHRRQGSVPVEYGTGAVLRPRDADADSPSGPVGEPEPRVRRAPHPEPDDPEPTPPRRFREASRDLQLAEDPELPPLRHRPGRLQHRHLDAAHRPGLAGPQPHRLLDRRRHHHGAAVPADAALRPVRRRPRRPAAQAPPAARHPGGDGRHRPRARRPDPHRRRRGLARLPRRVRCSASSTVVDNPARQSFVSEMVGPDAAAQRRQPQLGELPVRPARRPRRRRCADHRRRHAAGRSCSTACPSSRRSPACC